MKKSSDSLKSRLTYWKDLERVLGINSSPPPTCHLRAQINVINFAVTFFNFLLLSITSIFYAWILHRCKSLRSPSWGSISWSKFHKFTAPCPICQQTYFKHFKSQFIPWIFLQLRFTALKICYWRGWELHWAPHPLPSTWRSSPCLPLPFTLLGAIFLPFPSQLSQWKPNFWLLDQCSMNQL